MPSKGTLEERLVQLALEEQTPTGELRKRLQQLQIGEALQTDAYRNIVIGAIATLRKREPQKKFSQRRLGSNSVMLTRKE